MHLLNGPTEEQMNVIMLELNEDELRFENNINLLKKWYSCQEHLPQNYDETILPVFLRGCKHDIERTKRKLEVYFTIRKTMPELYANRDPTSSDSLTASRLLNIIPLPNLTKDGCRVTVHKLASLDSTLFNAQHVLRHFMMMGDIRVFEEYPISGDIIIMDGGNNITATHCAKFATVLLKKALTAAHEAYPQRLKQIHVVNFPDLAEKLIALVKSFMKEKLRNRFILHRNVSGLLDYLPASLLPEEYGGTVGDLVSMHAKWQAYLSQKKDWFQEQESVVAKGPPPAHLNYVSCIEFDDSIQGSFRKLSID